MRGVPIALAVAMTLGLPAAPAAAFEPAAWSHAYLESSSDMITPEDCDYPWKFEVWNDGHFHAGPCEEEGSGRVTGRITDEELSALAGAAEAVARGDLGRESCESPGVIAGWSLDLTLADSRTLRVVDATPLRSCHRGRHEDALALQERVNALMRKYYPRRRDGPTRREAASR